MTIQEIEAKKTSLEAELATALEAAKVLTPATPEFDEAYTRYLGAKASIAKIPEELAKAKLAENASAIAVCGVQVAKAIGELIDGLKVAELLGTPVVSLRYALNAEKDAALVVFNPVIKLKATGSKEPKTGTGRTVVVDPEGNRLSLTKFVQANMTDAEKDAAHADFIKYPHTAVDTKPKFEAFCVNHSLTGYAYEVPAKAEAS